MTGFFYCSQDRKRYGGMRDPIDQLVANAVEWQFQNRKRYGGMRDHTPTSVRADISSFKTVNGMRADLYHTL